MSRGLCAVAIVLAAAASARGVSFSVSPPAALIDPIDGVTPLFAYTVTLHGDGGIISAVDLQFTGNLWQIQAGATLTGTRITPLIEDTDLFPDGYQEADTHFLRVLTAEAINTTSEAPIPGAIPDGSSGVTSFLQTSSAISGAVPRDNVSIAQIVLRRNEGAMLNGQILLQGVPDGQPISGIVGVPEPTGGILGITSVAALAGTRRARRRLEPPV